MSLILMYSLSHWENTRGEEEWGLDGVCPDEGVKLTLNFKFKFKVKYRPFRYCEIVSGRPSKPETIMQLSLIESTKVNDIKAFSKKKNVLISNNFRQKGYHISPKIHASNMWMQYHS